MDFVLVHGIGASKETWDPLTPLLEPHGRVIVRDLPGFGAAPPLPDGDTHSVPNLASAVEGWMDDEELRTAHLVGFSMGGAIALELARRGRAITTTAIAPACGAKGWFEPNVSSRHLRLLRDSARRIRGSQLERLLDTKPFRPVLYSQCGHPTRPDTQALVAARERLADAPGFDDANESLFTHYGRIEFAAPTLAEIRSPTQILWGTRDMVLLPRQARRVAEAIPGAELHMLPGLGHLAMWDDPELCAELTLEFARREGGAEAR